VRRITACPWESDEVDSRQAHTDPPRLTPTNYIVATAPGSAMLGAPPRLCESKAPLRGNTTRLRVGDETVSVVSTRDVDGQYWFKQASLTLGKPIHFGGK
jgi:hypothetical protein